MRAALMLPGAKHVTAPMIRTMEGAEGRGTVEQTKSGALENAALKK
jgi:hypothetical protein